jgi:hypothetical protein
LSLALLPLGVAGYEVVMRSPLARSRVAFGAFAIAAVAALAALLLRVYAPRATFLLVGAMLGTIMTANVFLVIIPGQGRMLAATRAGTEVDTSHGVRAKQRSIHNHYLTFPVLFTMLAGHFPSFYGHPQAWLVLTLVFVAGAGIKAMMNFRTRTSRWVVAGTLASLAAAAVMTAPPGESAPVRALAAHAPVSTEEARSIVQMRCVTVMRRDRRTRHSARRPTGDARDPRADDGMVAAHAGAGGGDQDHAARQPHRHDRRRTDAPGRLGDPAARTVSAPDRFAFRGRRVVVDGAPRAASIHVADGRIARIGAFEDIADAARVVDAGERLLTAGLVDAHVHVNEPGRTEWEGFTTATRAAAAGGVTTLVDMPLNSIPAVTNRAGAEAKRTALTARRTSTSRCGAA